ncbi:MAG: IclR family transcriptional regulator [Rhodospirillales bacterium]
MNDDTNTGSRSIRVLDLLEVVCALDRPASAVDIELASGLPKATVHRLCNLMLEEGYLRRDISGRGYEAGERFSRLAVKLLSNQSGNSERHAILESVARDIGETCNIALPSAGSMLYLDRVESEWPLRIQLPTGSRVPLHCTASGKLYLSSLPRARRQRLIANLPMDKKSANTITDPDQLMTETDQIAKTKIGIDNEEFIPGMVAAAVPVTDTDGKLLATISTHGPIVRMSIKQVTGHVERLRQAADALARVIA